jgi:hypothetical protein
MKDKEVVHCEECSNQYKPDDIPFDEPKKGVAYDSDEEKKMEESENPIEHPGPFLGRN